MLAEQEECSESLALLQQMTKTVSSDVEQKKQFWEDICEVKNAAFIQCAQLVTARMDCTEVENGRQIAKVMENTPCDFSLSAFNTYDELRDSIQSGQKDCLISEEEGRTASTIN